MSLSVRQVLAISLVPAIFVGGPLLSVSCSTPNNNDAGSGPCQNGTIQLLECEPDDAGVQVEHFTDEACDGLDTAETRAAAMPSDSQAPAIDAPSEAQVVPGATPFTFTWHATGISMLRPAPATRLFTWRDDLIRWTTLVPVAEAHCPPFGGVAYAAIFKASNGQEILRAETGNRNYTPTADAWMRLRAAQGTITMLVEVARFSDNAVTEGPYVQATARHFTLAQ